MSKIWLSSDWHLGHANIAGPSTSNWKEGMRNFESIEQMDDHIINNMNSVIDADDTLWFLGDFSMGGHTKIPDYRRRINCKKIHFILGNHDPHIKHKYRDLFESVDYTFIGYIRKVHVTFNHFAQRIWEGSHKGAVHAYGHSHGSIADFGRSQDVGIDAVNKRKKGYMPIDFEEWAEEIQDRSIEFVDHHNSGTNVR